MSSQLPASIIVGLYKDSLVLVEESITKPIKKPPQFTNKTATEVSAAPTTPKKWWLGDNNKNIVVLLKDPAAVYINDEWLATLTKLLSACKLNLADIAIVNMQPQYDFSFIKTQLQPQIVLMFDVSTDELALPFIIPNYQLKQYDGCTIMLAPTITLSEDKAVAVVTEKRNLLNKLKLIFQV